MKRSRKEQGRSMRKKSRKQTIRNYNLSGYQIRHGRRILILLLLEVIVFYMCGMFRNPLDVFSFQAKDYIQYIWEVCRHPFSFTSYQTQWTPIGMVVVFIAWMMNYAKAIDKAGKKYMYGKEMGGAKWGDIEAFNKRYESNKSDENMILTMHARKKYDKSTMLNNNVAVVGGSGAGKTAGFLAANLLQFFGCNIYVDPKGDTLRSFGTVLEEHGVPVKVLNLINMLESLQYNPFRYITEEEHIDQLIRNIVDNTNPKDMKSGQDPFWEKAEIMCTKSLFFYVWLECPEPYFKYTQEPLNVYSELMRVKGIKLYRTPVLDETGKQRVLEKTMRSFILLLGEAEIKENEEEMSDLDCRILVLKNRLEREGKLPERHKAVDNYNRVMRGAKDTVRSIVISVNARFSTFNNEKVLRIFDDDEMELETIGVKKQAIFFLIPDDDTTYNFIIGMLYTQMFQTSYRTARKHRNFLPLPVGFWCDEFANIKMPENFEKILSTCRSRNIYIVIFLQSLAQLKTLYPNDAHEGILGNCDTFLYLGGNEKSSFKYLSEVLGKWTIDKRTNNQTLGKQGSVSVNNDLLGRELMMEDEVGMLPNDECIVRVRGFYPLRDKKCYWFQMPEYDYVKSAVPYQSKIVVREENGEYCTVRYKSPYKVYTEEELREKEDIQIKQIHPLYLLMIDLIEEEQIQKEIQELQRKGVEFLKEINLEEMDRQIEEHRHQETERKESQELNDLLQMGFSDDQMEVILQALADEIPGEQIKRFAHPNKSKRQMEFMLKMIKEEI